MNVQYRRHFWNLKGSKVQLQCFHRPKFTFNNNWKSKLTKIKICIEFEKAFQAWIKCGRVEHHSQEITTKIEEIITLVNLQKKEKEERKKRNKKNKLNLKGKAKKRKIRKRKEGETKRYKMRIKGKEGKKEEQDLKSLNLKLN